MLHKEWQQTREGQRVMFQCWLSGIEKACFLNRVKIIVHEDDLWLKLYPTTILVKTKK